MVVSSGNEFDGCNYFGIYRGHSSNICLIRREIILSIVFIQDDDFPGCDCFVIYIEYCLGGVLSTHSFAR